jgi:hypothetical protein
MNARMIVVKLNGVSRHNNSYVGPVDIETQTDFKAIIQKQFDTTLKGIAGYVLVFFNGKIYQCERDQTKPEGPYVRHSIKWHPLGWMFDNHFLVKFTSQSPNPAVVSS